MRRSVAVRLVVSLVVVVLALVALSRIDSTEPATRVEKPVADSALAR